MNTPVKRPWYRSRQPSYRIAAVGVLLLMAGSLGIHLALGHLEGIFRQLVVLFSAPGLPMGWWFITMSTWNAGRVKKLIIQGSTGIAFLVLGVWIFFGPYRGAMLMSLLMLCLACFHFYLATRKGPPAPDRHSLRSS